MLPHRCFSLTRANFLAPGEGEQKSLCGYGLRRGNGRPDESAQSPGLLGAPFFDGQDIHAQGSGVPPGAPEARGGPMVLHGAPMALGAPRPPLWSLREGLVAHHHEALRAASGAMLSPSDKGQPIKFDGAP